MNQLEISSTLTLQNIQEFIESDLNLVFDDEAINKIETCNRYLTNKIKDPEAVYYGINTGFGSLCHTKIGSADLQTLQENLLMSHACGVGEQVPDTIVRLMLLFKIKSLSLGYSGVKTETVKMLVDFLNKKLHPFVYKQGSLGASGDLAPLAHLTLPLIGKGKLNNLSSAEVLQKNGLQAIKLGPKEGLALINGTQFMTSYGLYSLILSKKLLNYANRIAALSLEAFDCLAEPFQPQIHKVRNHKGQIETAKTIRELLRGSKIMEAPKEQIQDPYSFRCIPQVHGATMEVIGQVENVFLREVNAVTDNPNIFHEDDLILSGGNFHGQILSLHADFLAMGMAELANISERRTYKLISGKRGLPDFLAPDPGLNSGFMIPQYTAASVVSLNKQLCTPSSVDSIVSSNGQEDHVSMGANAVLKLIRVVENVEKVLAIELFTACQAAEIRGAENLSDSSLELFKKVREVIPFISEDTEMSGYIQAAQKILSS